MVYVVGINLTKKMPTLISFNLIKMSEEIKIPANVSLLHLEFNMMFEFNREFFLISNFQFLFRLIWSSPSRLVDSIMTHGSTTKTAPNIRGEQLNYR
jgi:hypothetical protein